MLSCSSKAVVVAGITPAHFIFIQLPHGLSAELNCQFEPARQVDAPILACQPNKKFNRAAANSSLAWPHAAARLQLRRAPGTVDRSRSKRDVFTATDDRFRRR